MDIVLIPNANFIPPFIYSKYLYLLINQHMNNGSVPLLILINHYPLLSMGFS